MWKCLLAGGLLTVTAFGQIQNPQVEVANLREDVRGLSQRVGEMALRIEQLERENAELRQRVSASDKSAVTPAQLREAMSDINRAISSAVATSKSETLQQVSVQLEKLGKQTNAALDSLARSQTARTPEPATFSDDYPKEGISYKVQSGDTLAVIARKTGAKLQHIVNANRISDPSKIAVGQTLFIPGGK